MVQQVITRKQFGELGIVGLQGLNLFLQLRELRGDVVFEQVRASPRLGMEGFCRQRRAV